MAAPPEVFPLRPVETGGISSDDLLTCASCQADWKGFARGGVISFLPNRLELW